MFHFKSNAATMAVALPPANPKVCSELDLRVIAVEISTHLGQVCVHAPMDTSTRLIPAFCLVEVGETTEMQRQKLLGLANNALFLLDPFESSSATIWGDWKTGDEQILSELQQRPVRLEPVAADPEDDFAAQCISQWIARNIRLAVAVQKPLTLAAVRSAVRTAIELHNLTPFGAFEPASPTERFKRRSISRSDVRIPSMNSDGK